MRRFTVLLLVLLAACSTTRVVTISVRPPDAVLSVDGMPRGTGSLTEKFPFRHREDVYRITASRSGYKEQTIVLTRDNPSTNYEIELKPLTKRLSFSVLPVPAFVGIDGVPVSADPVSTVARELEFTKDAQEQWTKHTITASRPGFEPVEITVTWTDATSDYILQLQPMRKDVSITTTPPGATVAVDGEVIGVSPVVDKGRAFAYDTDANRFIARKIRLSKPGYDAVETSISWDDGKTDYHIDLPPKKKTVHIATDPAGAVVTIDSKVLPPGDGGIATAELTFAPLNERGDLPSYAATVTKKTAGTEWVPATLNIAWDDGKTDYSITLKEVKTRPVAALNVSLDRDSDGVWQALPRITQTLGSKDISEGPGREPPARLYVAPRGTTLGSLAISPSGATILFTLLSGKDASDFRSQILAMATDGTGGIQQITDGKALDVMPSFTPDGNFIVFASNRAGKRLNIWRKSLAGGAGIEQLTNGQEQDLWPMVDALPKPRLFYQAMSDSRPDSQLYVAPVEGGPRMDLATIPVGQPRVSPKADGVIFTSVNERTGNREIYRISDRGGPPVNLTNDPDSDCYDPAWSKDGNMIAFVSDRGLDEDRRRNPDVWILDLAHPDKAIQITANGSVDDCPVWDPTGGAIYFRSNRGGQWGIWRISAQ
ncbi:MAG: hypothetical protein ABR964_10490 [Tepidisphaeraceae bacterium]|jgi:dipeptidyl aminopeptidase/acylaminoacyl peptidase